jgi:hypothetical protein
VKNQMVGDARRILEKIDSEDARRVLAGLAHEAH